MRKKLIYMLAAAVLLGFALPFLLAALSGPTGVTTLGYLFVGPVLSVVMGCLAGWELRGMFWFPLVPAGLLLLSHFLLFHYLRDSLIFSGIALASGIFAMLLTAGILFLVQRRRDHA